jgi:hypothetical protein
MRKKFTTFVICFVVALVATITPAHAQDDVLTFDSGTGRVMGTLLAVETFDAVTAWEQYSNPMGVELGVENGVYRAYTMNGGYVWGLNAEQHTDIILEVEATPMNFHFGNGYGLMCRAEEDGDGYYFMINAAGYFSIAKGDGEYIVPLVDWQPSDAIHQEIDRNRIRAACVGSVLTLHVNNELVAEVTDTTYSAGFAGLSVAGAANTDADVVFDNLAMYVPVTLR